MNFGQVLQTTIGLEFRRPVAAAKGHLNNALPPLPPSPHTLWMYPQDLKRGYIWNILFTPESIALHVGTSNFWLDLTRFAPQYGSLQDANASIPSNSQSNHSCVVRYFLCAQTHNGAPTQVLDTVRGAGHEHQVRIHGLSHGDGGTKSCRPPTKRIYLEPAKSAI